MLEGTSEENTPLLPSYPLNPSLQRDTPPLPPYPLNPSLQTDTYREQINHSASIEVVDLRQHVLPLPPYTLWVQRQEQKTEPKFYSQTKRREETIEMRNIVHKLGEFTLMIPSLVLNAGELTYIGGEAGSGKSTLIRMLALEFDPSQGEIVILNKSIRALSMAERVDLRGKEIMYIPQRHLGLTERSPIENIQRPLHDYNHLDWSEASQIAETVLTTVGLPKRCFNKRLKFLSGGERARVAIAKAYAIGRPICLADEILAALDQNSRLYILSLFQELAQNGFTVIVIAHQPDLQNRFHRVIELSGGRIIHDKRNNGIVRDY